MRRGSVTLSGRFHFLRDCYTFAAPSTKHMDSRMRGNDRPGDLYVLPPEAGMNPGEEHPVRFLRKQYLVVNAGFPLRCGVRV
jgi:hypothetical protein